METWRDIPGYEGRYQVSDEGRVRSVDRVVMVLSRWGEMSPRRLRGVVLAPGRCRGYLIVNLSPVGTIAVHILVARAFVLGLTEELNEVNHRDGDKHNNAANNLEWTTRRGNLTHAVETGLNTQAIRVVNPATGEVYPSVTRAAKEAHVCHRTAAQWARA